MASLSATLYSPQGRIEMATADPKLQGIITDYREEIESPKKDLEGALREQRGGRGILVPYAKEQAGRSPNPLPALLSVGRV